MIDWWSILEYKINNNNKMIQYNSNNNGRKENKTHLRLK